MENKKGVIIPRINDNFNNDNFFKVIEGLCYLNPLEFKIDEHFKSLPHEILMKFRKIIKHYGGKIKQM